MGIKPDHWIRRMSLENKMISPFAEGEKRPGTISFGLSSYGYDMRITNEYKIFTGNITGVIDPKSFDTQMLSDYIGDICIIPPNSFVLARSVEYFKVPRDILAICFGKSTYARCGIIINVTPFEPEWEGFVTISIINPTSIATKIYSNEGIAQVLFLSGDDVCNTSYADKKGKYQNQQSIVLPKL
jgi:dCTP deaminase